MCLNHYFKRGIISYNYLVLPRYLEPTIYKIIYTISS